MPRLPGADCVAWVQEIVRLLFECGADGNVSNVVGQRPVHCAVIEGHIEVRKAVPQQCNDMPHNTTRPGVARPAGARACRCQRRRQQRRLGAALGA